MSDSPVASNPRESRDVLLNLPTQLPLNDEVLVKQVVQPGYIVFGERRGLSLRINIQRKANVNCRRSTDPE